MIKSKSPFYTIPPARGNNVNSSLYILLETFCAYTLYSFNINPNMTVLHILFCVSVMF